MWFVVFVYCPINNIPKLGCTVPMGTSATERRVNVARAKLNGVCQKLNWVIFQHNTVLNKEKWTITETWNILYRGPPVTALIKVPTVKNLKKNMFSCCKFEFARILAITAAYFSCPTRLLPVFMKYRSPEWFSVEKWIQNPTRFLKGEHLLFISSIFSINSPNRVLRLCKDWSMN